MIKPVDNGRWKLLEQVSYQGKTDCTDPRCSHRYVGGEMLPGCMGYHCPRCHAVVPMYGHECETS